jgi:hypothetical protein
MNNDWSLGREKEVESLVHTTDFMPSKGDYARELRTPPDAWTPEFVYEETIFTVFLSN